MLLNTDVNWVIVERGVRWTGEKSNGGQSSYEAKLVDDRK